LLFSAMVGPLAPPAARPALQKTWRGDNLRMALGMALGMTLLAGAIKTATVFSGREAFMVQVGTRNWPGVILQGGTPPPPPRLPLNHYQQRYDALLADTRRLPPTFYGVAGYAMEGIIAKGAVPADRRLVQASLARPRFDRRPPPPTPVRCDAPCVIRTNIIATRLIDLVVDGAPLPAEQVMMVDTMLAFAAPAGEHAVTYAPRRGLRRAYTAVVFAVGLWIVVSGFLALAARLTRERPARERPARGQSAREQSEDGDSAAA